MGQHSTNERLRDEELDALRESLRQLESSGFLKVNPITAQKIEARIRELEHGRKRGLPSEQFEAPAEVSLALGSAYFRSGSLADAEREYLAALAVSPKFGEAHNNLAVVYMLTGRIREAEAAVEKAEAAGFRVNPQLKKDIKARKN